MNKQTFNLHTHTARCGHAEGLDTQYITAAIDAGLKTLGFSEHIPFVEIRLANCRMFYEQKDEYLSSIRKWKAQYNGIIDIYAGYEIEYMEGHIAYLQQMRKECDYMILGQHCKYIGYEYDCYCGDDDILFYAQQIEDALMLNIVTYVAHPDYFLLGRRSFNDVCVEATHRIAKACSLHDIPLEINLNGFRYGKKYYQIHNVYEERYPYPFREFWEIIASYGCKVLYGFDAHHPMTLLEDHRIQLANTILEGIPLHFVQDVTLR